MLPYIFKVISQTWQPSTYRHLLYLVSGGMLGMIYIITGKALMLAGFPLIVAWLCVLALFIPVGFSRQLCDADRRWTNKMLGTAIVESPDTMREDKDVRQRVREFFGLSASYTKWRSIGWVLFRVVFGSQVLLLAIMTLLSPVYILVEPLREDLL